MDVGYHFEPGTSHLSPPAWCVSTELGENLMRLILTYGTRDGALSSTTVQGHQVRISSLHHPVGIPSLNPVLNSLIRCNPLT